MVISLTMYFFMPDIHSNFRSDLGCSQNTQLFCQRMLLLIDDNQVLLLIDDNQVRLISS